MAILDISPNFLPVPRPSKSPDVAPTVEVPLLSNLDVVDKSISISEKLPNEVVSPRPFTKSFKENDEIVKSFKEDMLKVLKQKRELGLIPCLKWENKNEIGEFADDIELIFLIANYKKNSEVLMREIEQMEEFQMITSSYLGYGLYKNNLVDKSILKDYDPNHP